MADIGRSGRVPGGGEDSGCRSSGLSRISQGVWWMTRWWWPHNRARLSREVSCRRWSSAVRWWAWHMSGGRVQAGKVQCRSRTTRAVQIGGGDQAAESADVEDLAAGAEDGGDDLGVAGQPAEDVGWEVGAVGGGPDPTADAVQRRCCRVWWSRVTRSRAGVAWVSGGRSVSRACWAVATRASHIRAPWSRQGRAYGLPGLRDRRSVWGAGEGEERGLEQGAVLGRPAAADPDSAGPVLG